MTSEPDSTKLREINDRISAEFGAEVNQMTHAIMLHTMYDVDKLAKEFDVNRGTILAAYIKVLLELSEASSCHFANSYHAIDAGHLLVVLTKGGLQATPVIRNTEYTPEILVEIEGRTYTITLKIYGP